MASTRTVLLAVLTSLAALVLAGCGGGEDSGRPPAAAGSDPAGWVDQEVTFDAGGVTIHATYRHPRATTPTTSVLLIAGSGPTDRDGNQAGLSENSLKLVAEDLGNDGVATLRYDKLFSGETGSGPYASDPSKAGVEVFLTEAEAALGWLSTQPRTDPDRLGVLGHSEGALYALLLAADPSSTAPAVHSLALVEPLSRRFLDIVAEQLHRQLASAVQGGQLTQHAADTAEQEIAAAIAAVRAGDQPGKVPSFVQSLFGPLVLPYLRQVDQADPADLAAKLPATTQVLLTCSANDPQITCADVDHLAAGVARSPVTPDFQHLTGMDHALKPDNSHTGAQNDADLPLFPGLSATFARFYGDRR